MRKRSTTALGALAAFSLLLAGCGDVDQTKKEPDSEAYTTNVPLADDIDPNGHIRTGEQSIPPSWDQWSPAEWCTTDLSERVPPT